MLELIKIVIKTISALQVAVKVVSVKITTYAHNNIEDRSVLRNNVATYIFVAKTNIVMVVAMKSIYFLKNQKILCSKLRNK